MDLPSPLLGGHLVRRYKRFFADVVLNDGETVTAHCPNTGTMLGLCDSGMEVWLSRSDNPQRKLAFTWEFARHGDSLVGINPLRANTLAGEALEGGMVSSLEGYQTIRREVPYGDRSRVDFLLSGENRLDCYVEVKNVHLKRQPGLAEFPDAVTARGAKHLRELTTVVAAGGRAAMLYLVQREDCERFAVAEDIDPAYAEALKMAVDAGVEVICLGCRLSTAKIVANRSIEFLSVAG